MNRSHTDPPQMGISPIEPVTSPQVMGDEKAPIDGHIDQNTGVIVAKKSGAERKHVARLDAIFMVYAAVAQVLKYLDQQNIQNAYVSGMKEDLHLLGNEYNYFITSFNVGYALFLIPSQIIITRVRPSWWLSGLEFCWGVLTIGLCFVKNAKQVYALRAFIGAFEASCYPGALTLLMSWYTPREIAFRIGIYTSCQFFGAMLSGALQASISATMHNRGGLSGWRWMFLIDGLMTVIWAVLGLFFIPDYPNKPNPWARFWLTPHHVQMAQERMHRFCRASNKHFTFATVKRTVALPVFWMFIIFYPACVIGNQAYNYFGLYLKSLVDANGEKVWSTSAVNSIPIGGLAIGVATTWIFPALSDYFQTRWLIMLPELLWCLLPATILTIWHVPENVRYFAWFATYLTMSLPGVILAWLSDLTPHDAEARSFCIGFGIAFFYAVGAWSNILVWPASTAPRFPTAWPTTIGLIVMAICLLLFFRYVELKWIRPQNTRIAEEKAREEAHAQALGARGMEEGRTEGGKTDEFVQVKDV
ncbi:major facilitator superfamily domain-containing protein [Phialemonium atrogriseum]|uniref:Major facilitator superfamily domain-containing protein n=1 Tax=Phialemonium atrogriseum TaxID=1093897 RepID=A0AAJ0FJX2_9PEZI|nr:major facilitator superfamily domain-containing protein [Phialemonium atrogriseum]KAK1764924.1 major facilitator superfamily domain-containing protein [Phialemonium atrogriseum]